MEQPDPMLVVDAANVVGSVPDGWWRDRRGAAERLRDTLVGIAAHGLAPGSGAPEWARTGPLDVVLVVEGAARGVADLPEVRVRDAPGSGDDLIVELVTALKSADPQRPCLVVSADRGLRARVRAAGAEVVGPRAVRPTRSADTDHVRALLTAQRVETTDRIAALSREYDGIVEANALTAVDDEHDPEGSNTAFERAHVAALLAEARDHLQQLDLAEERLDRGLYGRCENCGEPIPAERLEVRPAAATCVRCAEQIRRPRR